MAWKIRSVTEGISADSLQCQHRGWHSIRHTKPYTMPYAMLARKASRKPLWSTNFEGIPQYIPCILRA